ncbi:MAG TPA: APC family permease [Gammaproteobacteria bacterium]|nr:APC family permease [Gammaproteobacteria bacterium]
MTTGKGSIGFWSAVAIGVGGMVGGGIFAVLGLAAQLSHGATPIAFFIAGLVALITARSYAQLSVRYPSQGGTVEFLNQAFGPGLFTGGMNVLLWLSYIVMLALYAYAFGSYGASFMPKAWSPLGHHLLLSAVIVALTLLNLVGSRAVGMAEEWIVGFKVTILLGFIVAGLPTIAPHRLAPAEWPDTVNLIAGGMLIFIAYEGFELIANTAGDVRRAERTLPRAFYASVLFVIALYILVAAVTVGTLDIPQIVAARDYALAASARPFLGQTGYTLIAIAALLSTSSAINATLYGAARVSFVIAKDGELPELFERRVWRRPIGGLLLTSTLALIVANVFDLSKISLLGSAGFLLLFAAVNLANVRLSRHTGARRWPSVIGVIACLGAVIALLYHTFEADRGGLWILGTMVGGAFLIEAGYRRYTGRTLVPLLHRDS